MNLLQKIQENYLIIKDRFSKVHLKIEDLVDFNSQMLKSHLRLCKESNDGIIALTMFGEYESPGLKEAFINLSDALKSIEVSRTAMVMMLETSFISPMKELERLQKNVIKAEILTQTAEANLNKTQIDLDKKKEKDLNSKSNKELDESKIKKLEMALEKAATNRDEAQELLKSRKDEEMKLKITLEKSKLENMKRLILLLVQEYKKLHEIGVKSLTSTQEIIERINIKQESTSAILYPIPQLETPTYIAGIKKLHGKIKDVCSRLTSVEIKNNLLLIAHNNLQEETRKALLIIREYSKNETPGIQAAIENFSDALETVESNRQAFIKQMYFEFIDPIKATIEEGHKLEEDVSEVGSIAKDFEKWTTKLYKIRTKDAEKLHPGELEEAKDNVATLDKQLKHNHNLMTQNTHLFTLSKIKTFKNSLKAILERNLNFHDQAVNIIANSEILAKDIEINTEFNSVDLTKKYKL